MDIKEKALLEIDKEICEKRYDEAIKISNQGFKCFRDNCFLNKIAGIHELQKDYKGAVDVFKKMLKTEPNSQYLLEKTAHTYFKMTKFKDALKYYKLLLDTNPLSSKYNFNVACSYDFLKDYSNALKYYKIAIDADSNNISALNNYAWVCYTLKYYDTAIKIYNDIISMAPDHPEAYHHLGVINRDYLKDYEMALLYLKKAYRLDPDYILNSYQIALTYKIMKDNQRALEYAQRAAEINPNYKPAVKLLKELKKTSDN